MTGSTARRSKGSPGKLPWDRIRTRFDAVRESLKLSLRSLKKNASFAIVGFGTFARPFSSTPRLLPASRENLLAAIHELDGIKVGAPSANRSQGSLRGMTNLHAALRLAFKFTGGGLLKGDQSHVAPAVFASGCDTIFLLSDGAPTTDGFDGQGPVMNYPGYGATKSKQRDPETGEIREITHPARAPYSAPQSMIGPFRSIDFFQRDLERLNLFRKVEINAVGVGEYALPWLKAVTKAGLGQLRLVGGGQGKEKEPPPRRPQKPKDSQ